MQVITIISLKGINAFWINISEATAERIDESKDDWRAVVSRLNIPTKNINEHMSLHASLIFYIVLLLLLFRSFLHVN